MICQGRPCRNRALDVVSKPEFSIEQDIGLVLLLYAVKPQPQTFQEGFVQGEGGRMELACVREGPARSGSDGALQAAGSARAPAKRSMSQVERFIAGKI